MKNRTFIGIICIVLAVLTTFVVSPMVNKMSEGKAEIVRFTKNVPQGAQITENDIEVVNIAKNSIPEGASSDKKNVIGMYANSELYKGDIATGAKLTADAKASVNILNSLSGDKVAMSITITSFARGLSAKLQNGDIYDYFMRRSNSVEIYKRKRNILYEWLIRNKERKQSRHIVFYCYDSTVDSDEYNINLDENPEYINVALLLRSYPKILLQRIDEIMLNMMTLFNDMGTYFPVSFSDEELMYCETDNPESEISYVIDMMKELGYIISEEDSLDDSIYRCQFTLAGWKKIEELTSFKRDSNQAFIAMKLGKETENIASAIKNATSSMGYMPYKMDEIEHNNQIVPEMFYEISKSRLLIIDVSIPNLGAYYEARYAQALGKEVIVCCKRKESSKVHFDISQKNTILWDSFEELEKNFQGGLKLQ